MIEKKGNIIPTVHRLVSSMDGENYWFNAEAGYVMGCLGEPDYDYSFFAGLTGDNFTQHYKFGFYGDAASSCRLYNRDGGYFEDIFARCGYRATFVTLGDIRKNRTLYLRALTAYIDCGVPVIALGAGGAPDGVYVGYENGGRTLLCVAGDESEPKRVPLDEATGGNMPDIAAWIFVGEKTEDVPLAKLYRDAVFALPEQLTTDDGSYCFGAAAFRRWADDIDGGAFDGMKPEEFDGWGMHQNFVCVLSTNSGCCQSFLKKARELNPDMDFLGRVGELYRETGRMWGGEASDSAPDNLEALGGGFNITLGTLQDKEKRAKIAAKLREFAEVIDEVVRVLRDGLAKLER